MVGLNDIVGNSLDNADSRHPRSFPSTTRGSTLCISADFSGQDKGQYYEVYSFLVFDLEKAGNWMNLRANLRSSMSIGKRRVSFKALNDARRRKALIPFLEIADTLDGRLISFAVSKKMRSMFEGELNQQDDNLKPWKPKVGEQVLRVAHFMSLLASRYSKPSQNLTLFVDEDAIAANDTQLKYLTKVTGIVASHYLNHDLGHLRVGTSRSENGDLVLEDLLAVPDLAAGAIAEISRKLVEADCIPCPNLLKLLPNSVTTKSKVIGSWLSSDTGNLQKTIIFLDPRDNQPGMVSSLVNLELLVPLPGFRL
nr:hypothetical protein [uncultured Cohaesibacter sp.]